MRWLQLSWLSAAGILLLVGCNVLDPHSAATELDLTRLARNLESGQETWSNLDEPGGSTAALALFDALRPFEERHQSLEGRLSPEHISTYLTLTQHLRRAGGMKNQILSESLVRLALHHLLNHFVSDTVPLDELLVLKDRIPTPMLGEEFWRAATDGAETDPERAWARLMKELGGGEAFLGALYAPELRNRREMLAHKGAIDPARRAVLMMMFGQTDDTVADLGFLIELRQAGHSLDKLHAADYAWFTERRKQDDRKKVPSDPGRVLRETLMGSGWLVSLALGGPPPVPAKTLSDAEIVEVDLGTASAEGDEKIDLFDSPNGLRLAKKLSGPEGGRLAIDGGPPGPRFEQIGRITWSPDSRRVAYVGYRDGLRHVVCGDTVSEGYTWIHALAFSRNGNQLTFIGQNKTPGPEWIVTDGVREGPFQDAGGIAYSPSGHLAVFIRKDGHWHLRYRDHAVPGEPTTGVSGPRGILFSETGDRAVYVAAERRSFQEIRVTGAAPRSYRITDDGAGKRVNELDVDSDASRVAYSVKGNDLPETVFVNGEKLGEFDEVLSLAFAPTSGSLAMTARQGGEIVVRLGAKEYRHTGEAIRNLTISGDGEHLAYFIWDKVPATQVRLIHDGVTVEAQNTKHELHLSDTGNRLAWVERVSGGERVVLDGKPGPRYRSIAQLRLSERGRRYAFFGVAPGGVRLVVDGRPSAVFFDEVSYGWGPVVGEDGEYRAGAIRDHNFVSVRVSLAE